ncbi:activating signal cointegrator 1 complex subunit 2 homolog [Pollicipes pollicipes]|uniref:activating signal cointegrator 1 complex subunit 2 homolog n=1 Tax=Pollicipes pollicipes TaxID=41117 RepID=UPI0018856AA5|nr:activating signal cointegrator 1 complex subunit 2 homolog [Pollicipes pollicipes]
MASPTIGWAALVLLAAAPTSAQQGGAADAVETPVGGVAPANAVELATRNFIKLYNQAAALAAAAPDVDAPPQEAAPGQPTQPTAAPSLTLPSYSHFGANPFPFTAHQQQFFQRPRTQQDQYQWQYQQQLRHQMQPQQAQQPQPRR